MARPKRASSRLGYDCARIVAISLVALTHICAVSGSVLPSLFGLNIGQLGVAIFCILSGYFSMLSQEKNNLRWIMRRAHRIVLPYWLSLLPIFAANAVVGYKPTSTGLVVSEFLGTGYFTHPKSLVGVHVWFMSLLLVCYGIALVVRWWRATLPFFVVLTVCTMGWDRLFSAHVLSFLSGCVLATVQRSASRNYAVIFVVAALASGVITSHRCYGYPLVATLTLLACTAFKAPSPRWLALASERSYEFFLVHGPIYLGFAVYFHLGPCALLFFGTPVATIAAMLLWSAAEALGSLDSQLKRICAMRP